MGPRGGAAYVRLPNAGLLFLSNTVSMQDCIECSRMGCCTAPVSQKRVILKMEEIQYPSFRARDGGSAYVTGWWTSPANMSMDNINTERRRACAFVMPMIPSQEEVQRVNEQKIMPPARLLPQQLTVQDVLSVYPIAERDVYGERDVQAREVQLSGMRLSVATSTSNTSNVICNFNIKQLAPTLKCNINIIYD